MPHILPCPAPRTEFADVEWAADGRRRRRRRRSDTDVARTLEGSQAGDSSVVGRSDEAEALARRAHECPVPKPRGLIGEVLGFKKSEEDLTLSAKDTAIRKLDRQPREEG
ncbi:hypothetical protein MMC06_006027, partial [Schaereria dolodes]|nr:hypothetical protein [Schaereria dolodes]